MMRTMLGKVSALSAQTKVPGDAISAAVPQTDLMKSRRVNELLLIGDSDVQKAFRDYWQRRSTGYITAAQIAG